MTTYRILLVDDDKDFTHMLSKRLRTRGLEVASVHNGEDALSFVKDHNPDLVLVDLVLPDKTGVEIVTEVKSLQRDIPIIMISGHGETQVVVKAMQAGASDYVLKPVEDETLYNKMINLIEMRQARVTVQEIEDFNQFEGLIGKSPRTRQLIAEIGKIANLDSPVLIRGEMGAGKSFIAQLIHDHSKRRDKPFVKVNLAAVPPSLLEAELFGVERGGTGLGRERMGKWELAHQGTLFLDEIGDLPLEFQVKILRALQGGQFERVGGERTIDVDVRIIASTNRNLEQQMEERRFREDLFYRLNILPIFLPPLRERREDIPLLIDHFVRYYSRKNNKRFERLPDVVMQELTAYEWPANLRELQAVVEKAVYVGTPPFLKLSDFASSMIRPPKYLEGGGEEPLEGEEGEGGAEVASIHELEYRKLMQALEKCGGNISKTSKILGIGRDTVYRRMRKYKIGLKRAGDWR